MFPEYAVLNRPLAIVAKPDLIQSRCQKSTAGFDTARSASRAHHISLSSQPVIVDLLGFGLPPEIPTWGNLMTRAEAYPGFPLLEGP